MNAISVSNLCKTFKVRQKQQGLINSIKSLFRSEYKEIKAVDNISFDVKKGEVLGLIGPNGAGKSTTIKMLTGLLYPTSGEAHVLGYNPWKERKKLLYKLGVIFGQRSQLWYHLPPSDTFNLIKNIYDIPKETFEERLAYLSEFFDVKNLMNNPVRKLSLGQRMRVEFMASLLHNPEVLFLDEPTVGMDIVVKQNVRNLIKQINQKEGKTIFLTSHDIGDIEKLCKRVIIINYGKIVFDGKLATLIKNYVHSKYIQVKLASPLKALKYDGATIIEQPSKYSASFELNLRKAKLSEFIDFLTDNLDIVDLNVEDAPLEEIIARIYKEKM